MVRARDGDFVPGVGVKEQVTGLSVTGYILVGGESRRFVDDKALALYQGKPLVAWAVGALEEVGLAPLLVGPDPTPYRQWCQDAVTSETPRRGPVEAVRACLAHCPTEWALILSVDMPGVTAVVLHALLVAGQAFCTSHQVVCFARSTSHRQPFPGLYSTGVLPLMATHGVGGSMQRLLDTARVAPLGPDFLPVGMPWPQAFLNVNAPSDLSR